MHMISSYLRALAAAKTRACSSPFLCPLLPLSLCRALASKAGRRSRRRARAYRSFMEQLNGLSQLPGSRQQSSAAVLYHYPCADGVFSALAAHLYHSAVGIPAMFLPNTVYNPLRVDDLNIGVDVFYLLDYVGPKGFAFELCEKAKKVVILDHHKTALERLPPKEERPSNLHAYIDLNKSGATIAYEYFRKKLQSAENSSYQTQSAEKGKPCCSSSSSMRASSDASSQENVASSLPELVQQADLCRVETLFKYVEDADLWRWNLPNSKAFSSGFNDINVEFNALVNSAIFDQLLALDPAKLIQKGKSSLLSKQKLIDDALEKSFEVQLGCGKFGRCLGVRADKISSLRSELGNQLAQKSLCAGLRPLAAVIYEVKELEDKSRLKISLRSLDDDTTEVAQAYAGGGHQGASSFLIDKLEFEKWHS
ncbi:hypothetical protein O6H91_22G033300 [Diphasiastrum complanatum]|uniref:Uncharacterized protein n=1 Tax=Diphasiastrum complanatum TaxID=34168 RepID=A0ACC2AE97_DIPCM|nr:hypothetical protein O6H91_22G033300 [Diphasiastrum complanatum]